MSHSTALYDVPVLSYLGKTRKKKDAVDAEYGSLSDLSCFLSQ
jgi:hypothetical protein